MTARTKGGSRGSALADWIDSRTGMRRLLAGAGGETIPGGSRWVYVFGSALLTVLVMQTITGVLLATYYVPSVDHAHTTVAYVQKVAPLGWLVRGLHYYGASATIILLLLHLAQVFIWGAYKERREALWLTGVILLTLALGFGLTGYLLPWDQRAYYGTQVAGGIAAGIPLVGSTVSRILLGGSGLGQATLSRFFSLHVFLLPALTALLIVAHIYLFRYIGPAGPADEARGRARTESFYPGQFFKDTVAAMVVIGLLALLAALRPAPLAPRADPAVGFAPRPEWYFLWAFQLLKVLPAFVGGVLVPGALIALLAAAPFLDRSPTRRVRARIPAISIFLAALTAIGALTAVALYQDSQNPLIAAQEEAMRRLAEEPFVPDVIPSAAEPTVAAATRGDHAAVAGPPPPPESFVANCAGCHGPTAEGQIGPSLVGTTSRPRRSPDDLVALLRNPRAYGLKAAMPAFPDLPRSESRAIADWLAGLDGTLNNQAPRGQ